jgi:predicted O-methyltransferase YrrM
MLDWLSERTFRLGASSFEIATFDATPRSSSEMTLLKPRWLVQAYVDLRKEHGLAGGSIVELGIDQGGGTAFLAELFTPRVLLAVELAEKRAAELDRFIERLNLSGSVHPIYGVDQGDSARLDQLLNEHVGPEPLDLVVDDASHLLDETRASFNVLFPRLRPGGIFTIEDWSAHHSWERVLASDPERFAEALSDMKRRPTLSTLVSELVLACAYMPEAIAEVHVRNGLVIVHRGSGPLESAGFDLSQCYGQLGRGLLPDALSR